MRSGRGLAAGVVVVVAMMLAGRPAHAERRMLVLIDASGSMTLGRNNSDGKGATRFDAAKTLATSRIQEQAGAAPPNDPLRVAVFTFRGSSTLIPATRVHQRAGFIDANDALDELEALTIATDVGGTTPLAGAMCQAVDTLAAPDPITELPATTQILQVSSDGEENSTPPGTPCQGTVFTGTVTDPSQYPPGSYQRKVLDHITNVSSVIVKIDLFQSAQITLTRPTDAADPEGVLAPAQRTRLVTTAAGTTLNPLEQFFSFVAQATGGDLSIAHDNEALPISGDLNNDRCVDRADAILVARAFGPTVPSGSGRLDLNVDRVIDFADYQLQASRISPACGPDPYVAAPPIVCSGPGQIVLDGRAVESGAITIDVRSACQIVIRNSLIVAGQNAIRIEGSAIVKVDNSIIVGPNALRGTRGTIILSAANSIFHGALTTTGALSFINRGGNIFE